MRRGLRPLGVADNRSSSPQAPARRNSAASCASAAAACYRAFVHVSNGKQVAGHSQAILIG